MPPNCVLPTKLCIFSLRTSLKILNQEVKHFGLRHDLGKCKHVPTAAPGRSPYMASQSPLNKEHAPEATGRNDTARTQTFLRRPVVPTATSRLLVALPPQWDQGSDDSCYLSVTCWWGWSQASRTVCPCLTPASVDYRQRLVTVLFNCDVWEQGCNLS